MADRSHPYNERIHSLVRSVGWQTTTIWVNRSTWSVQRIYIFTRSYNPFALNSRQSVYNFIYLSFVFDSNAVCGWKGKKRRETETKTKPSHICADVRLCVKCEVFFALTFVLHACNWLHNRHIIIDAQCVWCGLRGFRRFEISLPQWAKAHVSISTELSSFQVVITVRWFFSSVAWKSLPKNINNVCVF